MKKTLVLFLFLNIFWALGCLAPSKSSAVKVFIEGQGKFPSFLVGTWKAETQNWEIVFESDGSISSAIIPLGSTRVIPGQTTTVPMRRDGIGIWNSGQWEVYYDPIQKHLSVEIVIDSFSTDIGEDQLKGNIAYSITGKMENENIWIADVISFPDYAAYTPEKHQLPMDPSETLKTVVFEKFVTHKD